jgi:hypothetical protein
MRKPKLPRVQLTQAGTPRQRAPGAGAPCKGRKVYLSRVTAECLADFQALAVAIAPEGKTPCLADAIEHAAKVALAQVRASRA